MRDGKQAPGRLNLPSTTHLFNTSHEELPTPPYKPQPSTSNLHEDHPESPSPAYASRSNINIPQMSESGHHYDDKKVRYEIPARFHHRNESGDFTHSPAHSRASSVAGTDDEDDGSDYDWSGEDDLIDEETKFEERMGIKQKKKGWGPKRIITLLFSSLIGSTFLAGVLVTPGILVHFYWYKPHPTDHRRWIDKNLQAWTFWAAANLLISWYLALIVDLVPVVLVFIVSGAWGHVSERVKSRVELYNSVKDTIKPLFYGACGWASWTVIFDNIYHLYDASAGVQSPAPYLDRVSQVVAFLFFLTLVLCIQKMLSHAIAFQFHQTAFKERLDELQTALTAVEKLRDYRPTKHTRTGSRAPIFGGLSLSPFTEKTGFDWNSNGGHDADVEEGNGSNSWFSRGKHKDKGKHKKRGTGTTSTYTSPVSESSDPYHSVKHSAMTSPARSPGASAALGSGSNESSPPHRYPPSRSNSPDPEATLTQAAKAIKSTLLHDARNIKGKDENLGALSWNVSSTAEAKRLARSIFMRFKDRRRGYLVPSDFYPAFNGDQDAAQAAFRVFDKDNNGDISRPEVKTALVKMYRERRFLSRSMRDVSVALKTLDHILLFFAFVILFFISLSVFGVEVGDSLTSVYSLGIAASFIFKNAASQAFDAIMFLFVTHPFDTGDRIFIDDENLVVKKMTLFATIFTRSDGTETYYFNSQLFSKFITNIRRSGKQFENLALQISWKTPTWKIDKLEELMNEWLSTEPNRWFDPSTSIMFQRIDYQRYLELTIGISHNSNWQDWGLKLQRKTAFHAAVYYYCQQLGIQAVNAPIPISFVGEQPQIPTSPFSADTQADAVIDPVANEQLRSKPALGFAPPKPSTNEREQLLRARKSKSRKAGMRGMGADG